MKKPIKRYINRMDDNNRETVDEFDSWQEANKMIKEYRLSDSSAVYYVSQRCCANWK
jgi:hypothetical protein